MTPQSAILLGFGGGLVVTAAAVSAMLALLDQRGADAGPDMVVYKTIPGLGPTVGAIRVRTAPVVTGSPPDRFVANEAATVRSVTIGSATVVPATPAPARSNGTRIALGGPFVPLGVEASAFAPLRESILLSLAPDEANAGRTAAAAIAVPGADVAIEGARIAVAAPLPRSKPGPSTASGPFALGDGAIRLAALTSPIEPVPVVTSLGEPRKVPKGAVPYLDIFRRHAKANGVPLWLGLGVAYAESNYNPKETGAHGVVGMMQVMPQTARARGYRGDIARLYEVETNIAWGMKELGIVYRKAKGDICMTVAKYKGGAATDRVNDSAQRYCSTVRKVTGMP